jgi:ABC-type Mn2+/Zn2+ transport system ATPase subunit
MAEPLLEAREAEFGYGGRAVVRRASLCIQPGEFVALLGENGSGKTTLLRGLLGLLRPLAGRVVRRAGLRIGYVPQRETLDPLYPLSALDVATLGAWRDLPFWRLSGHREREHAREALDACGALPFAQRHYGELSGGQRQRVLVARALASDPHLLFLDEPTAGIDPEAERAIIDLLANLIRDRGLAIWMVTHHVHAVSGHTSQLASVEDGVLRLRAAA